jgi:hypothetical protein
MLLSVRFKPYAFLLSLSLLAGGKQAIAAASTTEELMAAEHTASGITITVETGGCTDKSDFEVASTPPKDGKASVEFRRLNKDSCKGFFPAGLKLDFTWADLKVPQGTKLVVKNPIESPFLVKDPAKKTEQIQEKKPGRHRAAVSQKASRRTGAVHHRRIHRHLSASVKAAHSSPRRRNHARVQAHRRLRICLKHPHSRKCRHLMHVHKHRHRHHYHHLYCPL